MPFPKKAYRPKVFTDIAGKFALRKEKEILNYNKNARPHRDFAQGQEVLVRKNDKWNRGKIIKNCDRPRSYQVALNKGGTIERTSRHLRRYRERKESLDSQNSEPSVEEQTEVETSNLNETDNNNVEKTVRDEISSLDKSCKDKKNKNNQDLTSRIPIRATRARPTKLPTHLKDFVLGKK